MKNSKEKALELVEKFQYEVKDSHSRDGGNLMFLAEAKQCALIAVDAVIKYAKTFGDVTKQDVEELEQVKTEINNL